MPTGGQGLDARHTLHPPHDARPDRRLADGDCLWAVIGPNRYRPCDRFGPRPPTPFGRHARAGGRPPALSHSRPGRSWINDPQRPLKIGDTWTLWALYNPTFPTGGTNWRRWTSKDLVTWQDHGIAIPRNTTRFGDVWSGSTVVDTDDTAGFAAGVLVTLVTMPVPGAGQSCALWYSRDGGASFAFHDIVLPNPGGHKDFRDPTVFWHAPTNRWIMTLSEEGRIGIYTSTNLKHWTYASGFASTIVGRIMECSHLFKLHLYDANGETSADKWILLVGGNGTKLGFTVGTYYWVGEFDGTTFTADSSEGQWVDGGADFYAAVVWTDPDAVDPLASAYSMAWMSNWDYVKKSRTRAITKASSVSFASCGFSVSIQSRACSARRLPRRIRSSLQPLPDGIRRSRKDRTIFGRQVQDRQPAVSTSRCAGSGQAGRPRSCWQFGKMPALKPDLYSCRITGRSPCSATKAVRTHPTSRLGGGNEASTAISPRVRWTSAFSSIPVPWSCSSMKEGQRYRN